MHIPRYKQFSLSWVLLSGWLMHHEVQHVWSADRKIKQAKGILCHDWNIELGRVFDVASTNSQPNYKRMMHFIMCGPSLGSVCSQGTKMLTYIFSLSKELCYICTQSVSRRLAHTQLRALACCPSHGVMTSEQATVSSHVTDSPHVLPSQKHHGKTTNSCSLSQSPKTSKA